MWVRKFDIMDNSFFIIFNYVCIHVFTYMSRSKMILYFYVWNSALLLQITLVLLSYIDVVLTLTVRDRDYKNVILARLLYNLQFEWR